MQLEGQFKNQGQAVSVDLNGHGVRSQSQGLPIDRSVPKLDSFEKISGQAKYIDDYHLEGMLYLKTIRSEKACARIVRRHYPELPQGYYLIDYKAIPGHNHIKIIYEDWRVLAEANVSYIGEPICLLVGEDVNVLDRLAKEIQIEYETMEALYDQVHTGVHYEITKGQGSLSGRGLTCFERTYYTGYQEQMYIEPQGMVAYPDGDRLVVMGSIQCPYYVKNALIHTLNRGDEAIRVIQTTVGGAFGGKEEYPSLIACHVALGSLVSGKPVKLVFERGEDVENTTKRHPSVISIKGFIANERDLQGLEVHIGLDGGAFIGLSGVVLQRAMFAVSGVYDIPNLKVTGDVYLTNTVPTGAFRGFGAPQMFFAIEMYMQHLAKFLGRDPDQYKAGYLIRQGTTTATGGHFREPVLLKEMIDRVKEVSDYEAKKALYQNKGHRGIGMSVFLHGCGFTGSGEQDHIKAHVKLEKDSLDQVYIRVAAVDMGQGVRTTFTKLVAAILQIPMSQVICERPDTDLVPDSGPTVASRTMMVVGGLLQEAAKEMKAAFKRGQAMTVTKHYHQPKEVIWDNTKFRGDAYPAYSFGVNVVEVEVNPLTCEVTLLNCDSVYDIGKAIDERVILGQAEGGLLQGLAYGFLEEMVTKEGRVLQKNMTDYVIPTAMDTCRMRTELMDNPYALGPYGAKGAGELFLIGGAPAVAMAIEMAVQKPITRIPATPEYIMERMHDED